MVARGERRCAQCGCQLSRYNDAELCSARTRLAYDTPPVAPTVQERVWRDPEIQNALGAWDFGLASRLIRQRSSLRQADRSTLTGLSQAYLSMLEAGTRRLTNINKIIDFLVGLDVPDELTRVPAPRRTTASPRARAEARSGLQDPAMPWTASRMVAALNDVVEVGRWNAASSSP